MNFYFIKKKLKEVYPVLELKLFYQAHNSSLIGGEIPGLSSVFLDPNPPSKHTDKHFFQPCLSL